MIVGNADFEFAADQYRGQPGPVEGAAEVLTDLRTLTSSNLGRLIAPLIGVVLAGPDLIGPYSWLVITLVGVILREREFA
jgi:hypothetical protein